MQANLQPMFSSGTICIAGLPGIGSVGKIAADYLSTALECSTVKTFFSPGFPAQVVVSDGLSELLLAELKKPKNRQNLYVLSGDAQPIDVRKMYSLAEEILETAQSLGVTDIITLAAYVGQSSDKVVGAASDSVLAGELQGIGIPLLRNSGIGGLNGLLSGMAPEYGIRGFCLLSTTSGEDMVDLKAAKNLIEVIQKVLSLGISLDRLEFCESKEARSFEESDMNYR